jgi:pyroglutamyl-peptidase
VKRILLSGFEPFGGAEINPSQRIIEEIGEVPGVDLRTLVLPVVFAQAAPILLSACRDFQPDAVVALGQAEGRSEISVERIAINLADARIADNAGERKVDEQIEPGGPAARFTTLPARELVAAIQAVGVPAGLSLTAGAFLCNHVFYALQREFAGLPIRSGFVHVPLIPEQSPGFPGLPTLALDRQVAGIRAALGALAIS